MAIVIVKGVFAAMLPMLGGLTNLAAGCSRGKLHTEIELGGLRTIAVWGAIMPMGAGLQEPVLICCPFVMGRSMVQSAVSTRLASEPDAGKRTRSSAEVDEVVRRGERRDLASGRRLLAITGETSGNDRLEKR